MSTFFMIYISMQVFTILAFALKSKIYAYKKSPYKRVTDYSIDSGALTFIISSIFLIIILTQSQR